MKSRIIISILALSFLFCKIATEPKEPLTLHHLFFENTSWYSRTIDTMYLLNNSQNWMLKDTITYYKVCKINFDTIIFQMYTWIDTQVSVENGSVANTKSGKCIYPMQCWSIERDSIEIHHWNKTCLDNITQRYYFKSINSDSLFMQNEYDNFNFVKISKSVYDTL